jgi:glycosyl-4,4'-diaponeurosporenoate acyltransferase
MTNLSPLMTATSSALGWLLWSLLVGSLANRLPAAWLDREHWFMRRPWSESRQGFENRLGIRRWKPWLPDAGNALPKGIAKASLVGRESIKLERLVLETRRAELVHLALWLFWTITPLWLPPAGVLINLAFATAFNLPCLWVQRYNRLRLKRLLGKG